MLKRLARRLFMRTHRDELRRVEEQIRLRLGTRPDPTRRYIADSAIGMIDALEILELRTP